MDCKDNCKDDCQGCDVIIINIERNLRSYRKRNLSFPQIQTP